VFEAASYEKATSARAEAVTIAFNESGIPNALPTDVALALYRVLQESLANAVKHSGANHFWVSLHGSPQGIDLEVRDEGTGFMLEQAMGHGLGLPSMQERLGLVNGNIVFDTRLAWSHSQRLDNRVAQVDACIDQSPASGRFGLIHRQPLDQQRHDVVVYREQNLSSF
jgi:signal transduction histidine kinase